MEGSLSLLGRETAHDGACVKGWGGWRLVPRGRKLLTGYLQHAGRGPQGGQVGRCAVCPAFRKDQVRCGL